MAKSRIIGRCIYCDSTDGLTREHILPEGLGGRGSPEGLHEALVLGKATCPACQKITAKIEGEIMQRMWGHFRAATGLVRKDRRNTTRTVMFQHADGTREAVEMAPSDIPPIVAVPIFGQPGLFSNAPFGGHIEHKIKIMGALDRAQQLAGESSGVELVALRVTTFARLLAKIGLGVAIYERGIDGFKPLVRDLILGDTKQCGHWVGGPLGQPDEPRSNGITHDIQMFEIRDTLDDITYIAVTIRLFASLGGPRNYVIVGQALPSPP